jgi:hypothetical protein
VNPHEIDVATTMPQMALEFAQQRVAGVKVMRRVDRHAPEARKVMPSQVKGKSLGSSGCRAF